MEQIEMGPTRRQWEAAGPWRRWLIGKGFLAPDWCEAKVARGERWWDLDELLSSPERVHVSGGWSIVRAEVVSRAAEAMGPDVDRLRVRRLLTEPA